MSPITAFSTGCKTSWLTTLTDPCLVAVALSMNILLSPKNAPLDPSASFLAFLMSPSNFSSAIALM